MKSSGERPRAKSARTPGKTPSPKSDSISPPQTLSIENPDAPGQELTQQLVDLREQNARMGKQNQELSAKLHDVTSYNQALGIDLYHLDQEIVELEETLENNQEKTRQAQEQTKSIKKKTESYKKILSKNQRTAVLASELQSLQQYQKKVSQDLKAIKKLLDDPNVQTLENSIDFITEKIHFLYWNNNTLNDQLDQISKFVQKSLDDLSEENSDEIEKDNIKREEKRRKDELEFAHAKKQWLALRLDSTDKGSTDDLIPQNQLVSRLNFHDLYSDHSYYDEEMSSESSQKSGASIRAKRITTTQKKPQEHDSEGSYLIHQFKEEEIISDVNQLPPDYKFPDRTLELLSLDDNTQLSEPSEAFTQEEVKIIPVEPTAKKPARARTRRTHHKKLLDSSRAPRRYVHTQPVNYNYDDDYDFIEDEVPPNPKKGTIRETDEYEYEYYDPDEKGLEMSDGYILVDEEPTTPDVVFIEKMKKGVEDNTPVIVQTYDKPKLPDPVYLDQKEVEETEPKVLETVTKEELSKPVVVNMKHEEKQLTTFIKPKNQKHNPIIIHMKEKDPEVFRIEHYSIEYMNDVEHDQLEESLLEVQKAKQAKIEKKERKKYEEELQMKREMKEIKHMKMKRQQLYQEEKDKMKENVTLQKAIHEEMREMKRVEREKRHKEEQIKLDEENYVKKEKSKEKKLLHNLQLYKLKKIEEQKQEMKERKARVKKLAEEEMKRQQELRQQRQQQHSEEEQQHSKEEEQHTETEEKVDILIIPSNDEEEESKNQSQIDLEKHIEEVEKIELENLEKREKNEKEPNPNTISSTERKLLSIKDDPTKLVNLAPISLQNSKTEDEKTMSSSSNKKHNELQIQKIQTLEYLSSALEVVHDVDQLNPENQKELHPVDILIISSAQHNEGDTETEHVQPYQPGTDDEIAIHGSPKSNKPQVDQTEEDVQDEEDFIEEEEYDDDEHDEGRHSRHDHHNGDQKYPIIVSVSVDPKQQTPVVHTNSTVSTPHQLLQHQVAAYSSEATLDGCSAPLSPLAKRNDANQLTQQEDNAHIESGDDADFEDNTDAPPDNEITQLPEEIEKVNKNVESVGWVPPSSSSDDEDEELDVLPSELELVNKSFQETGCSPIDLPTDDEDNGNDKKGDENQTDPPPPSPPLDTLIQSIGGQLFDNADTNQNNNNETNQDNNQANQENTNDDGDNQNHEEIKKDVAADDNDDENNNQKNNNQQNDDENDQHNNDDIDDEDPPSRPSSALNKGDQLGSLMDNLAGSLVQDATNARSDSSRSMSSDNDTEHVMMANVAAASLSSSSYYTSSSEVEEFIEKETSKTHKPKYPRSQRNTRYEPVEIHKIKADPAPTTTVIAKSKRQPIPLEEVQMKEKKKTIIKTNENGEEEEVEVDDNEPKQIKIVKILSDESETKEKDSKEKQDQQQKGQLDLESKLNQLLPPNEDNKNEANQAENEPQKGETGENDNDLQKDENEQKGKLDLDSKLNQLLPPNEENQDESKKVENKDELEQDQNGEQKGRLELDSKLNQLLPPNEDTKKDENAGESPTGDNQDQKTTSDDQNGPLDINAQVNKLLNPTENEENTSSDVEDKKEKKDSALVDLNLNDFQVIKKPKPSDTTQTDETKPKKPLRHTFDSEGNEFEYDYEYDYEYDDDQKPSQQQQQQKEQKDEESNKPIQVQDPSKSSNDLPSLLNDASNALLGGDSLQSKTQPITHTDNELNEQNEASEYEYEDDEEVKPTTEVKRKKKRVVKRIRKRVPKKTPTTAEDDEDDDLNYLDRRGDSKKQKAISQPIKKRPIGSARRQRNEVDSPTHEFPAIDAVNEFSTGWQASRDDDDVNNSFSDENARSNKLEFTLQKGELLFDADNSNLSIQNENENKEEEQQEQEQEYEYEYEEIVEYEYEEDENELQKVVDDTVNTLFGENQPTKKKKKKKSTTAATETQKEKKKEHEDFTENEKAFEESKNERLQDLVNKVRQDTAGLSNEALAEYLEKLKKEIKEENDHCEEMKTQLEELKVRRDTKVEHNYCVVQGEMVEYAPVLKTMILSSSSAQTDVTGARLESQQQLIKHQENERQQIQQLQDQMDQMRIRIKELDQEIKEAEIDNIAKLNRKEKLKDELSEIKSIIAAAGYDVESDREQAKSIQRELDALNKTVNTTQQRLTKSNNTVSELQKRLQEMTEYRAVLESELDDLYNREKPEVRQLVQDVKSTRQSTEETTQRSNEAIERISEKRELIDQLMVSDEKKAVVELKMREAKLTRRLRKWQKLAVSEESMQQIEYFSQKNAYRRNQLKEEIETKEKQLYDKNERVTALQDYSSMIESMLIEHKQNWS